SRSRIRRRGTSRGCLLRLGSRRAWEGEAVLVDHGAGAIVDGGGTGSGTPLLRGRSRSGLHVLRRGGKDDATRGKLGGTRVACVVADRLVDNHLVQRQAAVAVPLGPVDAQYEC